MNLTKSQAKQRLGVSTDTALARVLGCTKQNLTGIGDDAPLPDSLCWRGYKQRPDVFGDHPHAGPTADSDPDADRIVPVEGA